jgi:hypothetical protein
MTTRSPTLSLAPAPYTAVQVVADIPKVLARLDETPCLTPGLKAKLEPIPLSGADRWTLTSPLSEAERSSLTRRKAALDAIMQVGSDDDVRDSLAPLWIAFPVAQMDRSEAAARLAVYAKVMRELPLFAVMRAVDDFVMGKVSRSTQAFAPTPAELAERSREHCVPYTRQRFEAYKLLTAIEPRFTPADMAARKARVEELVSASAVGV